ncbi:MAG: single-stranded DNA-binding protein [Deltaproteobacteria bacterium]|nr:single-stranded DNA-binding protein [Deltaproteobacteria bacterium]
MAGVNKVILVGNLGRDPEVRYAQSGTAVAKLNMAINERKKEGDEWIEHTEWVRVTCFGRTAENVGQYLSKGSQLYVEGRMQTSKYTDRDGAEKWSTEVVANNVVFLGGKGGGGGGNFGGGPQGGGYGGGNQGGGGNRGPQGGGQGPQGGGQGPQGGGQGPQGGGQGPQGGGQGPQGGGQDDGFYDDDLPF